MGRFQGIFLELEAPENLDGNIANLVPFVR